MLSASNLTEVPYLFCCKARTVAVKKAISASKYRCFCLSCGESGYSLSISAQTLPLNTLHAVGSRSRPSVPSGPSIFLGSAAKFDGASARDCDAGMLNCTYCKRVKRGRRIVGPPSTSGSDSMRLSQLYVKMLSTFPRTIPLMWVCSSCM